MRLEAFRNTDAASWPQRVRFEFEREIIEDEHPDLSWLEADRGRYDDVEDAEDRQRYEAEDRRRLEAYGSSWWMIGVRAKVTVWVPIGGNSFTRYELTSAGVWGVESDSGEEYLAEIFDEQKAELVDALKAIGEAAAELV